MKKINNIKWVITDPSTNQKCRRISTYVFEFEENITDPKWGIIYTKSDIITLKDYTFTQICDICEGYYNNMDELFKTYGSDSCQIIAECIWESELLN